VASFELHGQGAHHEDDHHDEEDVGERIGGDVRLAIH
jgi:hypothetical protein